MLFAYMQGLAFLLCVGLIGGLALLQHRGWPDALRLFVPVLLLPVLSGWVLWRRYRRFLVLEQVGRLAGVLARWYASRDDMEPGAAGLRRRILTLLADADDDSAIPEMLGLLSEYDRYSGGAYGGMLGFHLGCLLSRLPWPRDLARYEQAYLTAQRRIALDAVTGADMR